MNSFLCFIGWATFMVGAVGWWTWPEWIANREAFVIATIFCAAGLVIAELNRLLKR